MIAVVSSTVCPSSAPSHDGPRTTLPPEERLAQTQATIASLLAYGASRIFVADNSAGGWLRGRESALAPAEVFHFDQPPIRNKGIGELWLLLGVVDQLPRGEAVLKISGRYTIARESALRPGPADVVAKRYRTGRREEISTRCYLLRDRDVARRLWRRSLDEIYAQPTRLVGPRSLLRLLRASLNPAADPHPYADPPGALEAATYQAIRHLGLSLQAVEHLGVEGILGSWINPRVQE